MQTSRERILVSHAGSLPRPPELREMLEAKNAGRPYDRDAFDRAVREAVADAVRRQVEIGIDIVNDGELSKLSFTYYVRERLAGAGPRGDGAAPRPPPRAPPAPPAGPAAASTAATWSTSRSSSAAATTSGDARPSASRRCATSARRPSRRTSPTSRRRWQAARGATSTPSCRPSRPAPSSTG